ncbi:hypothetical protein EVC37_24025 [Methylocaldum sp. BRCS4]|nr:hypothetical protein [Methylocaldum sp. BRCS4]
MSTKQAFTFITALSVAQSATAFCWNEAAGAYGLDPRLLAAIGKVESGYNARAYRAPYAAGNRNGTYDLGVMQINSQELPGLAAQGVTEESLLDDPCVNIFQGARILREKINRVGPTWRAVGAYNAGEKGSAKKQRQYARAVQVAYDELLDKPLPQPSTSTQQLSANVSVLPRRTDRIDKAPTSFVIDIESDRADTDEEAPIQSQEQDQTDLIDIE